MSCMSLYTDGERRIQCLLNRTLTLAAFSFSGKPLL
jgi:hypothetical protein